MKRVGKSGWRPRSLCPWKDLLIHQKRTIKDFFSFDHNALLWAPMRSTAKCVHYFLFLITFGSSGDWPKKKVSVGTWVWNCWWKWVERLPGSRGKSKCILDCSNSKNWSWPPPSDFHWRWILARIGWWDRCCCLFHPNLSVFYRLASVSSVGFHLKNELFIGVSTKATTLRAASSLASGLQYSNFPYCFTTFLSSTVLLDVEVERKLEVAAQ